MSFLIGLCGSLEEADKGPALAGWQGMVGVDCSWPTMDENSLEIIMVGARIPAVLIGVS